MITVTKSYLPPLSEYIALLKKVWKSRWVTNHGPLVTELEKKIRDYLGVKYFWFVANGTIALQIALKALNIKGEVITTPFSYVASTSSIVWENCTPVFVDVDPQSLCIDTKKIEAAITLDTQAILAVHIYGNACDVEAIEGLAKKYNLKVIYDGAQAFGVRYNGASLLQFGDVSTVSFHATKVFHTAEGGGVITSGARVAERLAYMRNFGHRGEEAFWGLGINGKNSELHAAIGLCLLPRMDQLIARRKRIFLAYEKYLQGTNLQMPCIRRGVEMNYGYYPVIFGSEEQLLRVREHLLRHGVKPRRYFYPCLTKLNYVNADSCPIAEDISRRILCLPLYGELSIKDVRWTAKCIREKL
jgi:dTDP-4-amino-4,6-dideoxygalactose transaminase